MSETTPLSDRSVTNRWASSARASPRGRSHIPFHRTSRGVPAIDITWVARPGPGFAESPLYEVRAVGLAVKAGTATSGGNLFTATVSGSELAQLLRAGLAPSEAIFGVGIVRADMENRTRRLLRSTGPGEVAQFSEAVQMALTLSIGDLEAQASRRGELCIRSNPQVLIEHISGAGLEALVRVTGTAMRRFPVQEIGEVLPMLMLRPLGRRDQP